MNVNNSKNKNTISLIYVNIKSDKKTLHTFCFEGALRTKIKTRDCIAKWCWKNNPKKKKKNCLKYNIGMKSQVEIVTNNS